MKITCFSLLLWMMSFLACCANPQGYKCEMTVTKHLNEESVSQIEAIFSEFGFGSGKKFSDAVFIYGRSGWPFASGTRWSNLEGGKNPVTVVVNIEKDSITISSPTKSKETMFLLRFRRALVAKLSLSNRSMPVNVGNYERSVFDPSGN